MFKYDCERIKMNYGDTCKTSDGKTGAIDKNCNCVEKTRVKYDCPTVQKNIGDACTTGRGQKGTIKRDCNCS